MEKIIRANTYVLTWGTGFLTSSRLDFFITVGSQDVLPARTDPKPEYVAPAGLRGKRGLTKHVHGCLHCPRLICQQHVSCLQQKNAKNYRFFAILQSPRVIFIAWLNQHRSAPQDPTEEQLRKLATLGYNDVPPFSQSGASDLITSLEKKNATKNTGKTPQKTVA